MKSYLIGLLLPAFFLSVPAILPNKERARPVPFSPHFGTTASAFPSLPGNDSDLVENLLQRYPQYFGPILQNRDGLQVQVIYTRIDRDENNEPHFTPFYFNVRPERYFYPASTVKLPVVALALQRLNELRLPGLDKNSSMVTGAEYEGQTSVLNDPTAADGRPTVAQYAKKILLVSDNDAFNRLYEFLGQGYISEKLHKMGYENAEIRHRLEVRLTEDQNRHTNPVSFYDPLGRLLYQQPMQYNSQPWPHHADSLGRGYYNSDGQLILRPMDFSSKNRIGLKDLQQILQSILFPASVPARQRFQLKDEDYAFLCQYLSQYPGESKFPAFDTASYWDAYGKLILYGSEKGKLPTNIRIFNKEGDAYGFLTDITYIVDFDAHVEFMLSASIYCNSDGVLNDGKYDYDSVGLPFMKHLGQVFYDYDKSRPRTHIPSLLKFRIMYDR